MQIETSIFENYSYLNTYPIKHLLIFRPTWICIAEEKKHWFALVFKFLQKIDAQKSTVEAFVGFVTKLFMLLNSESKFINQIEISNLFACWEFN